MAGLSYPGFVVPQAQESSLAAFLPGLEAGRKEAKILKDEQSAQKGFGSYIESLALGPSQVPAMPSAGLQPSAQAPMTASAGSMSGNDAAKTAMQFYVGKGYSPHQAAGIVGNLMAESNLNTGALNPGDGADGSNSIGIAQWNGPRAKALQAYAAQNGGNPSDLTTQLGFVDHELNTTETGVRDRLRQAKNPVEAAAAFVGYERPQGWSADNPYGAHGWGNRARYASELGNAPTDFPTPTGPSVSLPPADVMKQLFQSPETRPMAIEMAQAAFKGQQIQPLQTFQRDDGSIWQYNVQTGEAQVLQDGLDRDYKRAQIEALGNKPAVPPTDDMREYAVAKEQGFTGTLQDWLKGTKSSGQTINVNTGDGTDGALNKALSEAEGKQWSEYKSAGAVSGSNAQDFDVLGELLTLAPQGPITGRLADTFKGFNSAADAAKSIIRRVAPTLRAPGSGATSDIEYQGMLDSLPSLVNQPEANKMILSIMSAKAQLNVARSEIITRYQSGEINIGAARQKMNELDRQSIMTPDMRKALLGLGSAGNIGADAPEVGATVDGYRFLGGDPSSPTSWEQVQ